MAIALAACSSGGGGGSSAPAPAGHWLVGFAGRVVAGTVATPAGNAAIAAPNLVIVDPQAPAQPVTVESGGQWLMQSLVADATYDSTVRAWTQFAYRMLVYAKGNRLYRVDLKRTGSPPAGVQLSSATTTQLCPALPGEEVPAPAWTANDFVFAERSMLVYRSPGADNSCHTSDDTFLAMRADMGPADAPIAAREVVWTVYGQNRALTGFLVKEGSEIRRVDGAFGNPATLFSAPSFKPVAGFVTQALDDLLFFQDGSNIKLFNLTAGSGPTTVLALLPGEEVERSAFDADGSTVYVATKLGAGGRIIALPASGVGAELASESGGPVAGVGATPTRIVFSVGDSLKSVPKGGGATTTLASPVAPWALGEAYVAGENVYYNLRNAAPGAGAGSLRVAIIGTDGSNAQELLDAAVIGAALPRPWSVSQTSYHAIFVANNLPSGAPSPYSGASLRAYGGAARSVLHTYGALPAGTQFFACACFFVQWGDPGLFFVYGMAGGEVAIDLYLFNSIAPGMTRVTNFLP
jgi:hypothetical protein